MARSWVSVPHVVHKGVNSGGRLLGQFSDDASSNCLKKAHVDDSENYPEAADDVVENSPMERSVAAWYEGIEPSSKRDDGADEGDGEEQVDDGVDLCTA